MRTATAVAPVLVMGIAVSAGLAGVASASKTNERGLVDNVEVIGTSQ